MPLNQRVPGSSPGAPTKRKSLQRSYNEQRPHSALGYLTPAAYPPTSPQRATGCATPNSSADRTLLHPRLMA